MARLGPAIANRALRRLGDKPDFWFTYHLYYKATDWIGPEAAARAGVPYIVAEASYAPKRAGGPWDISHRRVAFAVRQASAVLCLNPNDVACLKPIVDDPSRLISFPPFLNAKPYVAARLSAQEARARIASALGLPQDAPWLLAVGMMRAGDKARSFEALARILPRVHGDWRLLVVGDGPARSEVEPLLRAATGGRAHFVGALDETTLAGYYAAADLVVWPAVGEAFGMALLEAQASGTPAIAGRTGGVSAVVEDGVSGFLPPLNDDVAFADAVDVLLRDPKRRLAMGAAGSERVERTQSIAAAAARMETVLSEVGVR